MADTEGPISNRPRSKGQRSPSYPSIDLAAALRRAEQLYEAEGRHYAPVTAILQAWGYSAKSSGGRLAIAALKRFGLIEDRGSLENREARLTDLAQAIILDERENSNERLERIQQAALMPVIHRELYDTYEGGLPSDATLRYYLKVERGFSPGGAEEFIEQLRRTFAFARLNEPSSSLDRRQDEHEAAELPANSTVSQPDISSARQEQPLPSAVVPPPMAAGAASALPPIQFPVTGGATVTLYATAPLSEDAWDQMMAVLAALKSAVVIHERPPDVESVDVI